MKKTFKKLSKKRCGRDAASHCTPQRALRGLGHSRKCPGDFFAFFFSPEKRRYLIQPKTKDPTIRKQAFINSLTPKSVAGATRQVIAHLKKRCGVWDTIASVPATFLLLFSSPEKRSYFTQPQVSRCLFASFSALEKEVTTNSRGSSHQRLFCFFFLRLKKEVTKLYH